MVGGWRGSITVTVCPLVLASIKWGITFLQIETSQIKGHMGRDLHDTIPGMGAARRVGRGQELSTMHPTEKRKMKDKESTLLPTEKR